MTISFVIPVYNEQKRLNKTFKALNPSAGGLTLPRGLKLQEIIFVNDGSTDKSVSQISKFQLNAKRSTLNARIKLVSYKTNRGKGYAIRQGMKKSTADYTLFFDADMSTPLSQIQKFMVFFKENTDVIVGTRKNGRSTVVIHQPLFRELLGHGFTFFATAALRIECTDITCGFKAFSKKAREVLFQQAKINAWAYDAELLYLAKKRGLTVEEKAVEWSNDNDTKVTLTTVIPQTILDIARIHWYHEIEPLIYSRFQSLEKVLYSTTMLAVNHVTQLNISLVLSKKQKKVLRKKFNMVLPNSPLTTKFARYISSLL